VIAGEAAEEERERAGENRPEDARRERDLPAVKEPRKAVASVGIGSEKEERLASIEPEKVTARRDPSQNPIGAAFHPETERQPASAVFTVGETVPGCPWMNEGPESPSAVLIDEAELHRRRERKLPVLLREMIWGQTSGARDGDVKQEERQGREETSRGHGFSGRGDPRIEDLEKKVGYRASEEQ
jgi:hypothetical protein